MYRARLTGFFPHLKKEAEIASEVLCFHCSFTVRVQKTKSKSVKVK